jgi:hypothetical protein
LRCIYAGSTRAKVLKLSAYEEFTWIADWTTMTLEHLRI